MVCVKAYDAPECDRREILRYAGGAAGPPEVSALLESCLKETEGKLRYQVCWREFPISFRKGELDMGFVQTGSKDLQRCLEDSKAVVVFGATIGVELDRLITRYSKISPARALMFQAIGTERIEALADLFQQELAWEQNKQGRGISPRFSPGYGDLPLDLQRDIFQVLDCPRKIGLTLNKSLLMSPSKSVTAFIGIRASEKCEGIPNRCESCAQKNCVFRSTL